MMRPTKKSLVFDVEHERAKAVSRRVGDMTGLSISTSNAMQIINYGIDGEFDLHMDAVPKPKWVYGNRLATVLIHVYTSCSCSILFFIYERKLIDDRRSRRWSHCIPDTKIGGEST